MYKELELDYQARITKGLEAAAPDVARVTALVSGIMDQYNGVLTQVAEEARDAR
jgi:hypothetical protein